MERFIDCISSISNRVIWYANNCEICSKVDNGCPYYGQPYTEHEPLYCSGLDINKLKENKDATN